MTDKHNGGVVDRPSDAVQTNVPCQPLPIQPDLPASFARGCRFTLAIFLSLLSAYFGSIFFQGPLLPLAVTSPKLFRWAVDWTMASWLLFAEFLIVKLAGVRVRHFGDNFCATSSPQVSLVFLNHRTQLDWFFAWGLGAPVQRMKIILKDSLAKFPGPGWAMQCASFIFLRRQIATDRTRIDTLISYLLNSGAGCELLIFPEGTNLWEKSLLVSNQFAQKSNLPYVAYTLHPRCTGFVYLVTLLGRERLQQLYDVTVAYPDHIPYPEIDVFKGKVPSEVHYHVRRIDASELPWEADESQPADLNERLACWLRKRWIEKEQFLKQYYEQPVDTRRFEKELPGQSQAFCRDPTTDQLQLTFLGLANTIFWFCSLIAITYYLYTSWLVFLFAILIQTCFIYLSTFPGGVSAWASKHVQGPQLTGSLSGPSDKST